MAVAVALCFLAIAFSGPLSEALGGTGVRMEYESKLFNTDEIINVDIQMDEDTWNKMLTNAMSEEYYVCNVVINGKRVNNVAIRPKGNTSLSAIAMDPDTDRYSLKLEFDHFVEGQTCYGLDKLILNNNYADATNMKEAVIYDMYQYIGAEASLYNYAKVSVNGEYWGVYLALEAVEQSFMLRNFGTQDGELYKPDSMEMGGGDSSKSFPSNMGGKDSSDFDMSAFEGKTPPSKSGGFSFGSSSGKGESSDGDAKDNESGRPSFGGSSDSGKFSFDPENMPDFGDFSFDPDNMPDMGDAKPSGKGGFSMGGGGANLNYSDDDLDSYSTIWEGEITGTGKSDHRRVVTALKNISEGTNLETYLDIENVLKYMAVHTFAVNMDSLSGSMAHNYYLYEYDGQLNIFPWDYNLSLGGMSMGSDGDATSVVNDAIDTPFSGTKFFDALLSNEEYLEKYHSYLQQLVDEYVNGGRFDEVYNRIRNQIDTLVETDPTAFYPYDEYQTAAELLYETVKLRAESIDGQLDGTIPSTDSGQREDSSSLIDASHIDLAAMGKFSMGGSGDFKGRSDKMGGRPRRGGEQTSAETSNESSKGKLQTVSLSTSNSPNGFNPGNLPNGFNPGNLPEGFDPNNLPEGFDPNNVPEGFDPNNVPEGFDPNNLPEGFDPNNLPEGFDPNNMPSGVPNAETKPDTESTTAESTTNTEDSTAPGPDDSDQKEDNPFDSADESKTVSGSPSGDKQSRPSSASGIPGQSSGQAMLKNGIIYGLCLAAMIIAIFVISKIKRRK